MPVVVIRSEGAGTFCAGASFDELKQIDSPEAGKEFFMGFARIMLAMRRCPKPIITRIQGKVVGGGVGIVAASDYSLAVPEAPVRLSELAVGLGPFVVGPAIERRIGSSAFSAMALDADWRDAHWCVAHGLYTRICDNVQALDQVLGTLAHKLAAFNPAAITELKSALWHDTDSWDQLLEDRAAMSGKLVLSTSRVTQSQRSRSCHPAPTPAVIPSRRARDRSRPGRELSAGRIAIPRCARDDMPSSPVSRLPSPASRLTRRRIEGLVLRLDPALVILRILERERGLRHLERLERVHHHRELVRVLRTNARFRATRMRPVR